MSEATSLAGLKSVHTAHGSELLEQHTAPLDAVTSDVIGLRTVMVNLYAISEENGDWVLVDAGIPGSTERIIKWAEAHEFKSKPTAILLTHGHFDHVGNLEKLLEHWDVPVYAHAKEVPYLKGQAEYDPPDASVGGGLMSLLSPFYPKKPLNLGSRVQTLPVDNTVPGLPSWQWVYTPGHTNGHVSFFRPKDRVLVAGDAVITTKQESLSAILTQRAELHGPPAYFTNDWVAVKASVEKLAALQPSVIAAGHGKPIVGEAAAEALQEFAQHFDELGIPAHGKYVPK